MSFPALAVFGAPSTHGYQAVANGPVDITADVIGPEINLHAIGQLSLPAGTFAVTAKAGFKVMGPAGKSTEVGFDCPTVSPGSTTRSPSW